MSVRRAVFVLVAVGISTSSVVACEEDAPGGPGTSGGLAGDGGSTGPLPPGTAPTAAAADFCQKTLGVVVQALEACCTAEDKLTQDYKFIHGIAASVLPGCTSTLDASIAKSRVLWRATQGDACYAAYQSTYAAGKCANITQTFADPAGTACRDAFVGTGVADAPCMGDHECIEGLTCVGYTKVADGKCKPPPAIGEPCGPSRTDAGASGSTSLKFGAHPSCAAGARCDVFGATCVKASADGESCTSDASCATPLRCVLGTCGSNGPAGENGPCLDEDDCTPDLYCVGADGAARGTCKKKLPAAGACTGATFVTECIGRCDAAPGQPGQCKSFCGSL